MKKLFKYIPVLVAVLFLAVSCNVNEEILFKSEDANVGFVRTSFNLGEGPDATIQIPITLAGVPGGSVDVKIETSTEGFAKGAVEGTDFEITSGKTITFAEGYGEEMIEVKCLDDEIFTGNRSFKIVITDNGGLKNNTAMECVVNIIDNEHPLKSMLGTYSVTVFSYFTGAYETFDVVVTPDDEDVTKLWVADWALPYYGLTCPVPVYMIVDSESMTCRIPTPQTVGDPGYGPSAMYFYDAEIDDSAEIEIVGSIGDDWSIDMSDQGIAIPIEEGDYAGYWVAAQGEVMWTKK